MNHYLSRILKWNSRLLFTILISFSFSLKAQTSDTSNTEKISIFQKIISLFFQTEDSGMGVQFFHGEGIGSTRSFYLPGTEASFEVTTYQAQGVVAPISKYEIVSEDGMAVVNGTFSIRSNFPLDESWQKKKSSHEELVVIYNVQAGMYHLNVESSLRWRIVVYPYRMY
ncbi:MAG: hypothetical protein HOF04_02760 [Candidatus Marinimicrobia bacterium]|nr:hypothetical protein [Candidatus Neomarinimicrobiota bacterium]MBT3828256.1 hypothetical protein [Candidatus Neomarinimicrobiota bacterium]MBT3997173.1 hypothetical protein [Candidatus Neomarinimicrobiota bacterium]MBT7871161.1 hypothetical protein [Candidatus Neomarinimicrobiota bacterium]